MTKEEIWDWLKVNGHTPLEGIHGEVVVNIALSRIAIWPTGGKWTLRTRSFLEGPPTAFAEQVETVQMVNVVVQSIRGFLQSKDAFVETPY